MSEHTVRRAVVSGSFDPITKGHLFVIGQALKMADEVIVLVANNPDKKYRFSLEQRKHIITEAVADELAQDERVRVDVLPEKTFTAKVAKAMGAQLVVRGLRNVVDFEYEHSQQLINTTIEPEVSTVFVMPPTELIAISSSAIKGMVGIDGFEALARKYVPEVALRMLLGS